MPEKRHLLAKTVGTTLIVLTFGASAVYFSHQTRKRPQITAPLNQPPVTTSTAVPVASQPPLREKHAPSGLAIGTGVASNLTVIGHGSRPPRPLVLSAAQAQAVTDGMRRFAGQHAEISLAGNFTSEDLSFGDALELALLNADMFVTRNIVTMDTLGNGMDLPAGMSILVGKNRIAQGSAASALALLLINNRVVDGLIPAFLSDKNPELFAILVTGSSD